MSSTKNIAGISLGVMLAGFLATLWMPDSGALLLLKYGFEAGLVGGLADWFAVTALFRHPLGIPIPHTALLPKNREKVTASLVSLLENDLLSKESLNQKMRQLLQIEPLWDKLQSMFYLEPVKKGIIVISEIILKSIDVEKAVQLLDNEIRKFVLSDKSDKLLIELADHAFIHGYDRKALDFLLTRGEELLYRDEVRDKLGSMAVHGLKEIKTSGLMHFTIQTFVGYMGEEKLGSLIQKFLLHFIQELSMPDNPDRNALLAAIKRKLEEMANDPDLLDRFSIWKETFYNSLKIGGKLAPILQDLINKTDDFIHSPEYADETVIPLMILMINNIKADKLTLERIENGMYGVIGQLIDKNHGKIGFLVIENLNKLDNETLIGIMEDRIGKDIQWIRVNGAICGFFIGVVLGLINMAV